MTAKAGASKIVLNAFANYGGLVIQIAIAFFLSPFLVHSLGDTGYGIWSIVMGLSGYLCLLDLGIASSLTRYVSSHMKLDEKEDLVSVVNSGFALFTMVGIFIVAVSPLTAKVIVHFLNFDPEMKDIVGKLVIVISFDVALFLITGTFRGIFFGFQRYDVVNTTLICAGIYNALLYYAVLSAGYGLLAMGFVSLSGKVLVIIIYYIVLKKKYPFVRFGFSRIAKESFGKIVGYSKFTFLNMIANQIIYYTDSFVIGYFLKVSSVTYYSIAWTLMEYVKKFCWALGEVFIPAVSEYEAVKDYEKIQGLLITGTKFMLILTCIFPIGLIVFGGPFISLWMGEKYGELCAPILVILVAAQFFELPQMISYSILFGLSRHKLLSYASTVTSLLNLTLSIILVQKYGLYGVAMGTAIPQILLYGLFVPIYTNYVVKIPLWTFIIKTYGRMVIPGVIFYFMLRACMENYYPGSYLLLLAEALGCTLVFLPICYFLALDRHEKEEVKRYIGLAKGKVMAMAANR